MIKHYQLSNNSGPVGILGNIVSSLHHDNKGRLWVGSFNGVYRYQRNSDTFIPYLRTQDLKSKHSTNRNANFVNGHKGQLWVGMEKGVYVYNQAEDNFYIHQNARESEQGLEISNNGHAFQLFLTRSGTVLASMELNGLYKITPSEITVHHYRDLVTTGNHYGHKVTRAIYEDPIFNGNVVWLGLDGAGVERIEFSTDKAGHRVINKVEQYGHNIESESSSGQYIYDIQRDSLGRLWLATNCGLRQWSDSQQDFIVPKFETQLLKIDNQGPVCKAQLSSLFSDIKGAKLWFGGESTVGYLDLTTAESEPVWLTASHYSQLKDNVIYKIYQDQGGLLWLATNNGLISFNTDTGSMRLFQYQSDNENSLSLNWVQDITEMPAGTYWLATRGGGLNKLTFDQQQQPVWRTFDQSNGLADNFLYAILGDKQSNLWFSTNKGITRFNTLNGQSRNFNSKRGLRGYKYDYGGAHVGSSGQFYFGASNGFNTFSPDWISDNPITPKLSLQQLRINDQLINISSLSQLSLSHKQNYISFDFVGLHFEDPDAIRYQYFLTGFDKDWLDPTSVHHVRYSNIKSGQYEFYLKAANTDGVWSQAQLLTSFRIAPQPWQSLWNYSLYFLLTALLAWSYKKGRDRNC